MEQTLWVPGPLPGLNEVIAAAKGFGGRGIAYARMKREWTHLVKNRAIAERLKPVSRAHFAFRWQCGDRRHNPDNIAAAKKFILDGLVVAGVIANDGWNEVAGFSDDWTLAGRVGVQVTITPV